ncbi:MAG: hypothetical protein KME22_08130 [Hassallia sp. WJT32-NPBG1]|nr:hypothetical protein [Hassallia sp. WJT32-NPBG1]
MTPSALAASLMGGSQCGDQFGDKKLCWVSPPQINQGASQTNRNNLTQFFQPSLGEAVPVIGGSRCSPSVFGRRWGTAPSRSPWSGWRSLS